MNQKSSDLLYWVRDKHRDVLCGSTIGKETSSSTKGEQITYSSDQSVNQLIVAVCSVISWWFRGFEMPVKKRAKRRLIKEIDIWNTAKVTAPHVYCGFWKDGATHYLMPHNLWQTRKDWEPIQQLNQLSSHSLMLSFTPSTPFVRFVSHTGELSSYHFWEPIFAEQEQRRKEQ